MIIACAVALFGCGPATVDFDGQMFSQAEILAGSDSNSSWQPVELPHRWRNLSRPEDGIVFERYRISLTPGQTEQLLGPTLMLRATMNLRLYLDEQLIYAPGRVTEPLSGYWNHAHLVHLDGLLQPGTAHHIYLDLYSYPETGVLAPVLLGEREQLQPIVTWHSWRQTSINKLFFSLSLMLGLYGLITWTSRRTESTYLYFAATSLLWSVHNLNLFILDTPLDGRSWWWLVHSSVVLGAVAFIHFAHRLAGVKHRRIEQWLLAYGIGVAVAYRVAPIEHLHQLANAGHSISMLILLLQAIYQWRLWVSTRKGECLTLAAGCLLLVICGLQDIWLNSALSLERLAPDQFRAWHYDTLLAPIAGPLLLTAVLWQMMQRYIRATQTVIDLRSNLNDRIALVCAELESEHAKTQSALLEHRAYQTRTEIYRSLHEDLKDKLAALFFNAQLPDQAQAAREALRDLQEATLTAKGDGEKLAYLLTDIQLEAQTRADEANRLFTFESTSEAPDRLMSELEASSLRRVCREAISNALRHSGSERIEMQIAPTSERLILIIRDYGCGSPVQMIPGRGTSNMLRRMRDIGGQVDFDHTPGGGYTVRISLALRMP